MRKIVGRGSEESSSEKMTTKKLVESNCLSQLFFTIGLIVGCFTLLPQLNSGRINVGIDGFHSGPLSPISFSLSPP
jgi:hypothetical protein